MTFSVSLLFSGSSHEKHWVGSTSQGSGSGTATASEVEAEAGVGCITGVEEQPMQATNSDKIINLMSS